MGEPAGSGFDEETRYRAMALSGTSVEIELTHWLSSRSLTSLSLRNKGIQNHKRT
jgi:hypothetical protein